MERRVRIIVGVSQGATTTLIKWELCHPRRFWEIEEVAPPVTVPGDFSAKETAHFWNTEVEVIDISFN